jgi:hypothetical protein
MILNAWFEIFFKEKTEIISLTYFLVKILIKEPCALNLNQ